MFCYQLRKHIGALAAGPGGLDTFVFTGSIGERTAWVRWSVCRTLNYLGIELDERKNEIHAETISTPENPCTVRVIPTNEDIIIARHTRKLILRG